MTHNKYAQQSTKAKKNEPIFIFGVIWVVDELRTLIRKHGLGLLETNAVLLFVRRRLTWIPLKLKVTHAPV